MRKEINLEALSVQLANGTEDAIKMRERLLALLQKHDLRKWLLRAARG
jgi:hypothetical protein